MKYIKTVICLGLFYFLSVTRVMALDWRIIEDIKIMPTATPTPIKIEFRPVEMEIMPLTTATPTPVQVIVTQVVTATPTPETEAEISPTITQNPIVEEDLTATEEGKAEKEEIIESEKEKTDLSKWFLQITIGLLSIIIVILIWIKKKKNISGQ